jgi:hypothetical protein
MDPLSIATGAAALAKTAFELSKAVYAGVEAVRSVDTNLQDFSGELSALAGALQLVDSAFQDPALRQLGSQKGHSYTAILSRFCKAYERF